VAKKEIERVEALMRIVVVVVSGIILGLWKAVIQLFMVINFIITLFTGKRHKDLALLCEMWNTQVYVFLRYITFMSNQRPFPFVKLSKNMSTFK